MPKVDLLGGVDPCFLDYTKSASEIRGGGERVTSVALAPTKFTACTINRTGLNRLVLQLAIFTHHHILAV